MKSGLELTLPTLDNLVEIKKKYGTLNSQITDLIMLTGGAWTNSENGRFGPVTVTLGNGFFHIRQRTHHEGWTDLVPPNNHLLEELPPPHVCKCDYEQVGDIRPLINASYFFDEIIANKKEVDDGKYEVELGEYPQLAASLALHNELNDALDNNYLKATKNNYTINKRSIFDRTFIPDVRQEYEYHGKKYIYVNVHRVNTRYFLLSNNQHMYELPKNRAWLEVLPITWLIDEKNNVLLSKKCLLSGIFYSLAYKDVNYEDSDMRKYLNDYMFHDIFQSTKYATIPHLETDFINDNQTTDTFQPKPVQIDSVLEEAKIKMKKILNH